MVGAGLVLQTWQFWALPFGWGGIGYAREACASVLNGRGVVRYTNAAFLRLSLENCGLPLGGSRVYLSQFT